MLSRLDKLIWPAFSSNNRETRRILRRAELLDDPPPTAAVTGTQPTPTTAPVGGGAVGIGAP